MLLKWEDGLDRKGKVKWKYLCVGDNPATLVTLHKAEKWWHAYYELPGTYPRKEYALLERQIEDAEQAVTRWFDLALPVKPADALRTE